MLITKDISKLQPDYFKKLYDLRLYNDRNVPYEEYIFRFGFVVVKYSNPDIKNVTVYYKDTPSNQDRLLEYQEHYGSSEFRMAALPDVIIVDGLVRKNRYGNDERDDRNDWSRKEVIEEEYKRALEKRRDLDYEIACYQRLLKEPQAYEALNDWSDYTVTFKKGIRYYGYQSLDNPPHVMMTDENGKELLIDADSIKQNFKKLEK